MKIRFVDLFAGMGGTRIGFEQACDDFDLVSECVFSSELKPYAVEAYKSNFGDEDVYGDITSIKPDDIPDFDYLLAGFPCQPFSSAGHRHGFLDERGGLFFKIWEILKEKKPDGFLLENVDGLVSHDDGKTLEVILAKLTDIGYHVNYKILNSVEFGIPQKRKRVYIIGSLHGLAEFQSFEEKRNYAGDFIDYSAPVVLDDFTKLLSRKYSKNELEGKSIKDKRGGKNNIHSWDLELKGKVSNRQAKLLSEILKKRRYKKWAENKGIDWMDGMPLTFEEIRSFIDYDALFDDLEYLKKSGYLKFEHPKKRVEIDGRHRRAYKEDAEKGYNIVTGKLSFPITKIIHPKEFVPTLVATEAGRIAVATDKGVRRITVEEGLKFSGFPEDYRLDNVEYQSAFDLLGNTVMPPVIRYVGVCLLEVKYAKGRRAFPIAI